jgi:hypothetical protein
MSVISTYRSCIYHDFHYFIVLFHVFVAEVLQIFLTGFP